MGYNVLRMVVGGIIAKAEFSSKTKRMERSPESTPLRWSLRIFISIKGFRL